MRLDLRSGRVRSPIQRCHPPGPFQPAFLIGRSKTMNLEKVV
jgi:hypothetical protein